jgi:hypothetical protein
MDTPMLWAVRLLALCCSVTLSGCSAEPPAKDPLVRKLLSVVTDDFMPHELLVEGETLALEPTIKGLEGEGFRENFAVLPGVDYQYCGAIQVPIAGTARGTAPEDLASYALQRPGYLVALDVDATCRVVRARGWKVMPNSF